jgi:exodeoxyribonuclease VII large subunit
VKGALLTARLGAAVEDFTKTALRRYPGAAISLFPVRVQGEGAAAEMAAAISAVNSWGGFDVIVLTRGGGSAEDLWSFNEEPLVLAVSGSRVPVLAAVGHSKDLSLCELAADARAITPTAAAEAVFPDARAVAAEAEEMARRMRVAVEGQLQGRRAEIEALGSGASKAFARLLDTARRDLARLRSALAGAMRMEAREASERLARLRAALAGAMTVTLMKARSDTERLASQLALLSPARRIQAGREELDARKAALASLRGRIIQPFRLELDRARERLELLSPLAILSRGYSIAMDAKGVIVKRSSDVEPGDPIKLLLGEGKLAATVTSREESS